MKTGQQELCETLRRKNVTVKTGWGGGGRGRGVGGEGTVQEDTKDCCSG